MPAAIAVHGLSFAYPDGVTALDQVRFEVEAGDRVGLIGPNGAGKTTLFLCLAGVLKAAPGVVRLSGLDPSSPAERRQLPAKVGIVFQNSDDQLFSVTVADDVAFGPLNLGLSPEETRSRVAESLERVGLRGYEARPPHHLSGGEKRRAALAGVLAMRPEILLLDEPSMFLDARGRRDLIRFLRDLPGTMIIASHDLEMLLDLCPRLLLLDGGRVMADGPAETLLGDADLMERHGMDVPHRLRKG